MGSYTTKVAAASPIESIQRGKVHNDGEITILPVDTSKTFVNLTILKPQTPVSFTPVAVLINSTTIRVSSTSSDLVDTNARWAYEVIEYA